MTDGKPRRVRVAFVDSKSTRTYYKERPGSNKDDPRAMLRWRNAGAPSPLQHRDQTERREARRHQEPGASSTVECAAAILGHGLADRAESRASTSAPCSTS